MKRLRERLRALLVVACLLLAAPGGEDLGQTAFDRGDYATAILEWSKALKATHDDAGTADLLLRLAAAYREAGRLAEAGQALDKAAPLARDGAAWPLGRGLLDLAYGDARSAEKQFRTSFSRYQDAKDPAGAANAAVDLGLSLSAQGRLDEAIKAQTAALQLFDALHDPVGRADALVDRGIALRHQGALGRARADLEAALAIYRTGADRTRESDALANLGLVLEDVGETAHARDLYTAALANARARRDLGRQAILLQDLGALEARAGNRDEAAKHWVAAEAAFTALGRTRDAAIVTLDRATLTGDAAAFQAVLDKAHADGDRGLEASAAVDLANLHLDRDPEAAARHAARARDLAAEAGLGDVRWRAAYVLGVLALRDGRDKAGLELLEAAVDDLERTRRELSDEANRRFLLDYRDVYQALIDAELARDHADRAFVYAQRLQLAELGDAPIPADAQTARVAELESEQAWVESSLAAAPTGERADALRVRLADLRVEFARTVDELRAIRPDFDAAVRIDPEDLEALQAELDPGVTVLQPLLFDDRLVLLVFRDDGLVARTVTLDGKALAHDIHQLAASLRAGNVYEPAWTKSACESLGTRLLDPIREELAGTTVLVVSAEGVFRELPFALLRTNGRWLAEDTAIVGITHVGSLRRHPTAEARFRVDGPGMLLVGNPDGTLPGAEAEVKKIAERFPGATVRLGGQGTRDELSIDLSGKVLVHLATHGNIDPSVPDRSYLTLAPTPTDDGRLGYGQIPGLAPWLDRCRLVVLSACESGLPVAGDPGSVSINGLAAQFRRAGVETLVASLWRVDDEGTLQLMDRFYAAIQDGEDVAHALQSAQVGLLAQDRWSHPWYWAGFVVVGDWR